VVAENLVPRVLLKSHELTLREKSIRACAQSPEQSSFKCVCCTTQFATISEPSNCTANSARFRPFRRYRLSPETPNWLPVTVNFAHFAACLRLHNPYLHFARDVEVWVFREA
jgi:hypothetical protein